MILGTHTRDPDTCKYPFDAPIICTCPGCKKMKPAGDSSHTYAQGDCKHMTIPHRKGVHRKGSILENQPGELINYLSKTLRRSCLMEPI